MESGVKATPVTCYYHFIEMCVSCSSPYTLTPPVVESFLCPLNSIMTSILLANSRMRIKTIYKAFQRLHEAACIILLVQQQEKYQIYTGYLTKHPLKSAKRPLS